MDINLKRDLSLSLQDELRRRLVAGENVLISLPGSFGEALAVTDRRALVIRDSGSGSAGFAVYAYPLALVKGADVASTGAGGYIEFKLADPVSEPDTARVYYPSYDAAMFQKAADSITQLVSPREPAPAPEPSPASAEQTASAVQPVAAAPAAQAGSLCPKCRAAVEDRAAYCDQCGEQLRRVCPGCGGSSRMDASHCSVCGAEMVEYVPACAKCGSRVQRWMSYCTACGSAQHQNCLACGTALQPGWIYCGACGRELGSGALDPRASRSAMRRLDEFKEAQKEEIQPAAEAPKVEEPAPVTVQDTASAHNDKGRELFDSEDVEGAIREFEQAVRLDPNNGLYRCNLAVAYDENDQDELAFQEYGKALEIDPNDVTALLSLGYMYNEGDEREKAEEVWGKILQIAPDTPEAQEVRQNLAHQDEL